MSGRDLVLSPERVVFRDRSKGTELFHYSMLQTTEYRERYGYWQYATDFAPMFMSNSGLFAKIRPGAEIDLTSLAARFSPEGVVYQNWSLTVQVDQRWLQVPEDVLESGVRFLTGLVDERFVLRNGFPDIPEDGLGEFSKLAAQQPGDAEVRRYQPFLELAERYRGATGEPREHIRREMKQWHAQERPCQRQKIQASLSRVIDLLREGREEA